MPDTRINRPGAPTNTPQHLFDNGTGITEGVPSGRTAREGAHRQTGAGTSPDPDNEAVDPHPADEEHPYREARPGGAGSHGHLLKGNEEIGANPARHDGNPPPRPHNRGSGPD